MKKRKRDDFLTTNHHEQEAMGMPGNENLPGSMHYLYIKGEFCPIEMLFLKGQTRYLRIP